MAYKFKSKFKLQMLGVLLIGLLLIAGAVMPALADGGAVLPGSSTKPSAITRSGSSALFTDVPADHWALADLQYLAERGIITGYKDGKFHGDQPLTRYAAVALVARAIRFLQSNPDFVTNKDLQVLQDLIYKINDKLQELDAELNKLKSQVASGGGVNTQQLQNIETRVQQNTRSLQVLQSQVQSSKAVTGDYRRLRDQANASFIIALAGLFVGILGIALATM